MVLGPGDVFGHWCFVGTKALATYIADEDSVVSVAPVEHLATLLDSDDGLAVVASHPQRYFYTELAVHLAKFLRDETNLRTGPGEAEGTPVTGAEKQQVSRH